ERVSKPTSSKTGLSIVLALSRTQSPTISTTSGMLAFAISIGGSTQEMIRSSSRCPGLTSTWVVRFSCWCWRSAMSDTPLKLTAAGFSHVLAVLGITTCTMGSDDAWLGSLIAYSPLLAVSLATIVVFRSHHARWLWLALPHVALVPLAITFVW